MLGPDARQDPSAAFAAIRERGDVIRIPDRPGWIVVSHRHTLEVLGNPDDFSSSGIDGDAAIFGIVSLPPGAHGAERQRIAPSFGRKALGWIQPQLDELAAELVASVPRGTPVDVHAALSLPMSRRAMAALTGVDVATLDMLRELGGLIELSRLDWLITGGDELSEQRHGLGRSAIRQQAAAFRQIVRSRASTGNWPADLTTQILGGPVEPTRAAIRAATLVGAGAWLTLPNGGLNSVSSLLAHVLLESASTGRITPWPAVDSGVTRPLALVAADPRSSELFLGEVLRLSSPSQWATRTVTTTRQLAGAELHAGDRIVCSLGAANRDPAVFTRPDELIADRDPNPALAFGYGPHLCIGREFARMQARSLLHALATSFSRIDVIEIDWMATNLMRSPIRIMATVC